MKKKAFKGRARVWPQISASATRMYSVSRQDLYPIAFCIRIDFPLFISMPIVHNIQIAKAQTDGRQLSHFDEILFSMVVMPLLLLLLFLLGPSLLYPSPHHHQHRNKSKEQKKNTAHQRTKIAQILAHRLPIRC